MNTIPFGPRNEDPLLAKAAELPKEVAPPRDLWPSIAARLAGETQQARPRVFGWPAAIAAGFVVASVSVLLTWGLMRDPAPAVQGEIAGDPVAETTVMPVNYGPNSGLTAMDLVARDELLVRFREKFGQLRPETREAIVKNLAVIQTAADEIDAALAQDPASAMLNGLLVGAYKQELQLYSMVVTSGDGFTRRT
ncbi:MAG TPA: hypothetical protein VGA24_03175 [Steroidobacteraceae bacterium]